MVFPLISFPYKHTEGLHYEGRKDKSFITTCQYIHVVNTFYEVIVYCTGSTHATVSEWI